MVDSAIKDEEDKKEYFDSEDELEIKILQLTEWVRESKCFIAFTGAGISTSSGIADFRSGINTSLDTGPGVWEKKANIDKIDKEKEKNYKKVPMTMALPSPTHMSLVKLANEGILKFCISQNVDGLHRKSNFPKENLAELHGNTNLERCSKCNADYFRDFSCRNAHKVHDHKTGRFCTKKGCGGELNDSIINFKESLPEKELNMGFYYSKIADLHLVLGSSLRVSPASDMPLETINSGGKVVIVNLQKTPISDFASLCIFSKIDIVMEKLMKNLDLKIQEWTINRRILFTRKETTSGVKVIYSGLDTDNSTYSILKASKIIFDNKKTLILNSDPSEFIIPNDVKENHFEIECQFQGYYKEPNIKFKVNFESANELLYLLEYFPLQGKWKEVNFIENYSQLEESNKIDDLENNFYSFEDEMKDLSLSNKEDKKDDKSKNKGQGKKN